MVVAVAAWGPVALEKLHDFGGGGLVGKVAGFDGESGDGTFYLVDAGGQVFVAADGCDDCPPTGEACRVVVVVCSRNGDAVGWCGCWSWAAFGFDGGTAV